MSTPVLVLVHGTRFDSRQWDGYAELVPEADLVTVDLPGHGSHAGSGYSTDAAVAVISEVIDRVEENRPVVLAGHSLGGYVATTYAQRHPARLGALVLIGACADPARHPLLRHLYSGFARLLPLVGPDRMAAVINPVFRRLGARPDALPGTAGYAVLPEAWAATTATAGSRQLEPLDCPVFLVGGQFDQLRIDTAAYAAACRDPRVRIVPRASHLLPLTHAPALAQILREAVAAVAR